jgi:hypothetical protein
MAAATNMGCASHEVQLKDHFFRYKMRTADLDVLPEIQRTTIPVIVAWPFRTVNGDDSGKVERLKPFFRQVLDAGDIVLSNFS